MKAQKKSGLPGGKRLNLERRLLYRFSILSTKVIRHVAEMYGPKYGLLPSGWKVMAVIGRFGSVFGKEVCAQTSVEPHKVTRAVDRLVQLGYVVRQQDTADGRRVMLSLTAIGQTVYADIETLTRQVELALQTGLSKQELDTFSHILGKLEGRATECQIEYRTAQTAPSSQATDRCNRQRASLERN